VRSGEREGGGKVRIRMCLGEKRRVMAWLAGREEEERRASTQAKAPVEVVPLPQQAAKEQTQRKVERGPSLGGRHKRREGTHQAVPAIARQVALPRDCALAWPLAIHPCLVLGCPPEDGHCPSGPLPRGERTLGCPTATVDKASREPLCMKEKPPMHLHAKAGHKQVHGRGVLPFVVPSLALSNRRRVDYAPPSERDVDRGSTNQLL
jgi:hypothetical protein